MQQPEVTVETAMLKSKLTQAYAALRAKGQSMNTIDHFQDLWDLKEQALLQHKSRITVPSEWLYKVEEQASAPTRH